MYRSRYLCDMSSLSLALIIALVLTK
jgi:hypothetical protein